VTLATSEPESLLTESLDRPFFSLWYPCGDARFWVSRATGSAGRSCGVAASPVDDPLIATRSPCSPALSGSAAPRARLSSRPRIAKIRCVAARWLTKMAAMDL
jgi:hypothetical protein